MTDRISLLIKAKNLSAAQFADEIGVQRSSISHLMSGRNKPSLDLIQKTLQRFPEVSSEWLLFGKGEMVRELNLFDAQTRSGEIPLKEEKNLDIEPNMENETVKMVQSVDNNSFVSEPTEETSPKMENAGERFQTPGFKVEEASKYVQTQPRVAIKNELPKETGTRKNRKEGAIDQIIVLYDDHTFIAYSPGS